MEDTIIAFREKVSEVSGWPRERISLTRTIGTEEMAIEQMRLTELAEEDRIQDSWDLWRRFGNNDVEHLWDSRVSEFRAHAKRWPRGRVGECD